MGGGIGDIKRLVLAYPDTVREFKHAPMEYPVILLVDNDDGAKPIFSAISSKFHVTANFKTELPFYHLCHNLFLIKTPSKGADGKSCIEDCFPQEALQTKVDGKSFNPNDHINPASEYGKIVFAERVVRPNAATIDFSEFAALLKRVVAVFDHHKGLKKAGN